MNCLCKSSNGIGLFACFFFLVYHPSLYQFFTHTEIPLLMTGFSTYCPWADHGGSLISTPPLRWIKWDRRRWRKCLKIYNIDYNYVKHQINLIWFRWVYLSLIWCRWVKILIKDQINRQRNTSLVYSVYTCMNKWIIRVTSHPPLLHSLSHTETPQQARVNTQISLHSCWSLKKHTVFKKRK